MGLTKEELAILVTGKDVSATRTLRGVNRELNKTAAIAGKAGRNLGRNIERGVIIGATAAAGAIGYAVNVAGDFEAQLNTINTIARTETPEALAAIGDSIRSIARDTGTPLEELTTGYYDLLSAGIKAADAQNVLTAANRLAIGGLATTAETVDLLTTAINTYGGDASQAGAYADFFAKAVERGKVTADEIAASFAVIGPIASASGIEITEVAAAYARLTAAGVPGAEAATQMRSAIVGLMKVTTPLAKLQKQTGRNYFAIAGKKGLVYALQLLREDADKAGVPLIKLLGRVEGVNFALQTTGPNFDAYNADLAAVGDSAGTAAEQMAERQKGLNYEMAKLKANVQDAAITIGTELLPVFGELAAEGTDWLKGHQPEIAQFARDLANGIRDAVAYAKSLDWDAIARALGMGAEAVKTIVSTFLAMPPELQGLLVGGYAANKVTGGAVGDLAGVALKGVLSQFVMRGSPANPMYVVPIGGGLGGGVPGAVGGLLGTAVKMILPAAVLIEALSFVQDNINMPKLQEQAGKNVTGTEAIIASRDPARIASALAGLRSSVSSLDGLQKIMYDLNANGVKTHTEGLEAALVNALVAAERNSSGSPDERQDRADQQRALDALDPRLEAIRERAADTKAAVERARINMVAATRTGDASIVAAIRALRLTSNVSIPLTVRVDGGYVRVTSGGTLLRVEGNAFRGAEAGK